MTDWSKKFDERERRMDESEEPEKEKINVVTEEEEEHKDEHIWSGLLCVYCKNYSIFIYEGNSICGECYDKEVSQLIKNKRKSN